jgi:hypothetical protein
VRVSDFSGREAAFCALAATTDPLCEARDGARCRGGQLVGCRAGYAFQLWSCAAPDQCVDLTTRLSYCRGTDLLSLDCPATGERTSCGSPAVCRSAAECNTVVIYTCRDGHVVSDRWCPIGSHGCSGLHDGISVAEVMCTP